MVAGRRVVLFGQYGRVESHNCIRVCLRVVQVDAFLRHVGVRPGQRCREVSDALAERHLLVTLRERNQPRDVRHHDYTQQEEDGAHGWPMRALQLARLPAAPLLGRERLAEHCRHLVSGDDDAAEQHHQKHHNCDHPTQVLLHDGLELRTACRVETAVIRNRLAVGADGRSGRIARVALPRVNILVLLLAQNREVLTYDHGETQRRHNPYTRRGIRRAPMLLPDSTKAFVASSKTRASPTYLSHLKDKRRRNQRLQSAHAARELTSDDHATRPRRRIARWPSSYCR